MHSQNNIIGSFVRLEQLLMTNGYSKEDLIIVSVPTADQVSVMISSASLIAESNFQEGIRKTSVGDGPLRKISASSIEKKVSFDRGVSIQEEDDVFGATAAEAKPVIDTLPENSVIEALPEKTDTKPAESAGESSEAPLVSNGDKELGQ